jgi:signal transduction histidine kinase
VDLDHRRRRADRAPGRRDVVIAAACGGTVVALQLALPLAALSDPTLTDDVPGVGSLSWVAGLVLLVAQAIAVVWRRRHVVAVTAVVAAAVPVGALLPMGSGLGLTSVAVLVALYTAAMARPIRRLWLLLGWVLVSVTTGHLLSGLDTGLPLGRAALEGLLQGAVVVAAPLLVALVVATRAESRSARTDQARALQSEHAALVQRAIARERAAMARELHDIAAHHLTGIAIMSAAVSTQIDTDPAAAKQSVGELRHQSTEVLRDLRSLVALLRDDEADGAPDGIRVESLAGIADLVDAMAETGRDIGLTVLDAPDGQPLGRDIGPLAQLAAYRMVQESLSNAARHAPGARCEVLIDDRDADALVVTVRNSPPPATVEQDDRRGFGLIGMQERADLTGSTLLHGPLADGGWQVRLRTPRTSSQEDA